MATYTINVTIVESGTVKIGSNETAGNIQEEGAEVNLLAIPASGFSFVSYVIDGGAPITTNIHSFIMPSSNVNLIITFGALAIPTTEEQESIYDTSCPKFFFVRGMSERYFTGDVIDIRNYDITEIEEPIGFDAGMFRLERDENYHGFNYEFSVSDLEYSIGDTGYNFLKAQLYLTGTDSDVKFVYGFGQPEAFTVYYLGKVDMNEYSELEDGQIVKFSLVEVDFDNLLQTAFEVPQLIDLNQTVRLYSKVIPKRIEYKIPIVKDELGIGILAPEAWFSEAYRTQNLPNPESTAIDKTTPPAYVYINDGREGNSDFNNFITTDFRADDGDPFDNEYFVFKAEEAGIYTIDVKFWMGLFFVSPENFTDFNFLKLVTVVKDPVTNTWTQQNTYDVNELLTPTGLIDPDKIAVFDRTLEVQIEVGYEFYLYIAVYTNDASFPAVGAIDSIVAYPFGYDYEIPQMAIVGQTKAGSSNASTGSAFDVVTQACKKSAEVNYDILKSDFLSTGCASLMYLTNGFNIRGLVNRSLKASPKQLIDMLSRLYCLGWGVEYSEYKEELIVLEPVEYFYQDVEIISLDNVSNYTKEIDTNKYYNELEIGFSKYSKQRETDKGFTLDDFHTKHVYQTPIRTNKNKLSIITDLTLSAYEIEILRRKQFIKDGNKASSSYSEDDNVFGIQLSNAEVTDDYSYPNDKILNEEGTLTVISGSYPLVLTVGDEVTYISRASVSQTRNVVYFFVDSYEINGTPVITTYIGFAEQLTGATTGAGVVTIQKPTGSGTLQPEGAEAFESVENLLSPATSFNLRHSPKRMLYRWAKLLNGGFFTKLGTDSIQFKQGDGNIELTTKLSTSESCLLGDLNKDIIAESADVTIDNLYNRGFLYVPIKVSFGANITFQQLIDIKKCLRGQDVSNRNYGYITITNYCGDLEKVYITSLEYSPVTEEATFEGYLKTI